MKVLLPDNMDQLIMESWRNCALNNINPANPIPKIYSETKIKKLINKNKNLILIFKESVQKVRSSMPGNYIYILADRNGILLDYICNNETEIELQKNKIKRGLSLQEDSIGTNAISLAIQLQKPVYFNPEFHYCHMLRKWYCYTVPLKKDYEIIGFLDVSTIDTVLKEELVTVTRLLGELIIKDLLLQRQKIELKDIGITNKQIRILGELAKGYTEYAIAKDLGISVNTIRYHKKQIYKQLSVHNICEAIAKAFKYGIIDE